MKKIFISLLLISIGVITGVLITNTIYSNYITNGIITNTSSNSITKSSSIAMMLETSSGSGMYELSTNTSWPTSGYVFNITLSKCENGSTISWNSASNTVIVTGNNSDKCYIYFDKASTLQTYSSGNEIWSYSSTTTKIVFDDSGSTISDYEEVFDLSEDSDESILAYVVDNGDDTNTIYIISSSEIYANENMTSWFYEFTSLQSIEGLEKINTSNVKNMNAIFYNCKNLTTLDLSSWDTSNVTNMQGMFYDCTSITTINISNFNTSKVTTMYAMFAYCNKIENLDLSSFDTSNVTNVYSMFVYCYNLISIDLSNADFSNVETYGIMFYGNNSSISVTVKNSDAYDFITARLSEYNGGTVVIA